MSHNPILPEAIRSGVATSGLQVEGRQGRQGRPDAPARRPTTGSTGRPRARVESSGIVVDFWNRGKDAAGAHRRLVEGLGSGDRSVLCR